MHQCSARRCASSLQDRGTARLVAWCRSRLQRQPRRPAVSSSRPNNKGAACQAARQQQEWSPLDSDDFDDADSTAAAPAQQGSDGQQAGPQPREDPAAGKPGGGLVGFFVAGWMAVLALIMQLLSPVLSLGLFMAQPLTQTNPVRARAHVDRWVTQLPQGFWARLHYLWERPVVKSIRITASIANWSVRLPAIAALLLAQGGALASTISFPMLAPLLLGTGMMINSIKANASFIIPRLGLLVVLLWVLWFFTNVIQTTWVVLCKQGRIDLRTLVTARMITECTSLLLASIVVLSMLGINISGLLLPTGVVLAIASRDLLQNFIAGFFLVLAQPFRLGDKVAVSCSVPGNGSFTAAAAAASSTGPGTTVTAAAAMTSGGGYGQQHSAGAGARQATAASGSSKGSGSGTPAGWFEGVCEKVDLRYTVLRDGRRRLMVPNTAFVSREFMVYDDGPEALKPAGMGSSSSSSSWFWQQKSPTANPTSSTDQAPAAAAAGAAGDRSPRQQQPDRQASPEPAIIEGHMTTQLPPLAPQPVFPGMHFVAPHPGYPPFPAMHYQHQQPLQGYPFPPEPLYHQQDQGAAGYVPDPWQQQHQHQQQQQEEGKLQQQHDQQQQEASRPQQELQQGDEQQQQQQQQQGRRQPRQVAKGPPGYLPQGYSAVPPYLGIPMGTLYYGVPGIMAPWPAQPAGQQPSQAPAQPHAPAPEQQQQPGRPRQQVSDGGAAAAAGSRQDGPGGGDGGGGGRGSGGSGPIGSQSGQTSSSSGAAAARAQQQQPQQPPLLQQQQSAGAQPHAACQAIHSGPAAGQHHIHQHQQQPHQHQQQGGPSAASTADTMHMASAAGLGLWGMAPGAHLPQPWQQLQPGHLMVGSAQADSSSSSPLQQPHMQHMSEEASPAAEAAVEGGEVSGGDEGVAAPADAQQGSSLLVAVLQEISRQQS